MAYNNNIPLSTDLISTSQGQILGNFAAIDSGTTGTGIGFSRNHITMTDATNGGLHNRVDYYQVVASPAISGFVASAYPKTVTNAELFYKNAVADMQITNSLLTASSGQGMLPGGLQIRFGTTGGVAFNNTTVTVTFSLAFPNAVLGAIAIPYAADLTHQIQYIGTTALNNFQVKCNNGGGSGSIVYIVIGY
jgi:hypothetical protein